MRLRFAATAALVIGVILLAACQPDQPATGYESLPPGDAGNGEALYNKSVDGAPACSTCHNLTEVTHVGPGFAGFSDRAGERVNGLSAGEYAYQSITSPVNYTVSGYSNVMYPEYALHLSDQDIADLIAFLLQQ